MATIVTVHGTGATGPEEGQAWWQKGSEFERHIRELVEGADGKLDFKPLLWDGPNSETVRRHAAKDLYEHAKEFESRREKYNIIGHSHGGSIIASALLQAAYKRNPLPNLAQFITIGTPFIRSVKAPWLFTRSGLIGKSALVAVVGLFIFAWAFVLMFLAPQAEWFSFSRRYPELTFILFLTPIF